MTIGNPRFYFLGTVAEVMIRKELGQLQFVPIPTSISPVITTVQMIDLGIVYKGSTILETIEDWQNHHR